MFQRGDTYDTTYLALGNLAYYWILNILGFIYVNASNLNCQRPSLLFSQHASRTDFVKTILFAPIFFYLGNNIALRAEHDLSQVDPSDYTFWSCVGYNLALWTPGYVIGLQFTHFDIDMMRNFSLSPAHMQRWDRKLWCVAIFLLVALVGVLSYIVYLWHASG